MTFHPSLDSITDDTLEKQLEKLFSDVALPGAEPAPESTFSQSDAARLPRLASQLKWPTALFGLAVVFMVATRIFAAGASSGEFQNTAIVDYVEPANTQPTVAHVPPTAVAVASPLPLSTPNPPRDASPTHVTSIPPEKPTLTSSTSDDAMLTPTASPVPSISPQEVPAIGPPQPVVSATITPAPAYALGLDQIPTPVSLVPMPDRAINIALLGSDQRPNETQWRTDVVIVVSVNPETPSVSMLSIPRDTWLYIPNWTYQRINLADVHGTLVGYPGGGPGLVKAVIEYNLGIHIDYYARVNFDGLIRIVDALGGVNVMLDCPVEDGFPDDPITEDPSVVTQISYPDPGIYHVDGKHALWLARSRYTTSEFARSRRQHRILQAMWVKANELGFITRLPELWDELTSAVETDLSLDDMLWLASVGLQLEPSQIYSGFIDGRYLSAWISPGGANVLLPHTEEILAALEPVFNPYPLKAPQGFNRVEVWNGSGHAGWGYLAADKLLRNGFEVIQVREADALYETSAILDFTVHTKGSPLPLLQSLFNAGVSRMAAEEQSTAPFRLVVGADYQPCDWPSPAQWQPTPTP